MAHRHVGLRRAGLDHVPDLLAKVKDNPNIPKGTMQGFDWAGAVFVLLMFGALVCVPPFGQQNGWASVATLASIGVPSSV